MTIGDRIKQRRTELNMSQEELARKIGYKDRSTISYIEKGDKNFPIAKVEIIADALRTTPAWIMGWEEETQEIYDEKRILFDLAEKADENQVKAAIMFMRTLLGEE